MRGTSILAYSGCPGRYSFSPLFKSGIQRATAVEAMTVGAFSTGVYPATQSHLTPLETVMSFVFHARISQRGRLSAHTSESVEGEPSAWANRDDAWAVMQRHLMLL